MAAVVSSSGPSAARRAHKPATSKREDQHALTLDELEPWPHPVDGTQLANEIVRTLRRFLALPEGAVETIALWLFHSHAHDAAQVSPILLLTSPVKACGKSTTLNILARLVPRPLLTSNISPASLFRGIATYRPTVLLDEGDSFLRDREDFRNLLCAGHTRFGAKVFRCADRTFDTRVFTMWCPKVLALIGRLSDTIESRSIEVRMRRRAPNEHVEPLRLDRFEFLVELGRQLARWSEDHLEELREADPLVPSGLGDREADNWRPLLAIAERLGLEWTARARQIASQRREGSSAGRAAREELLVDVSIILQRFPDYISTAELLRRLCGMEDRPWSEWRDGRPMSAHGLAMLLGGFGIKPSQFRVGTRIIRGYHSRDFQEAFARYLPEQPVQAVQPATDAGMTCPDGAPSNPAVNDDEPEINLHPRSTVPVVPVVADTLAEQPEAAGACHASGNPASPKGSQEDERDA